MPNNLITLDAAIKMTTLYRQEMNNILAEPFKGQNILAVCETFNRAAFDTLLAETNCTSIRVYYGMGDDLKVHAIIVGVNSDNQDILPSTGLTAMSDTDPVIIEEAFRCPDYCPTNSPLYP